MGAYDQVIKKVLNGTVEKLLERTMVLEKLATTQYQGELTGKEGGDTVTVAYEPDITVRTATPNTQLTYDQPSPTTHEIRVDTAKYFVYKMDAFEEKQMGSNMAGALMKTIADKVVYQFTKNIEDDIASLYTSAGIVLDTNGHYTNGGADISNASALSVTSSNVFELFDNMCVLFDEANIPMEDRFAVVPPWACGKLRLTDRNLYLERMIDKQITGKINEKVCGFNVYSSNSVKTSSTTYYPLFGVKKKSFAVIRQINPKAEDASRPDYFESAVKMKILYGVDCHRSDMLGVAVVSKGTE